MASHGPSHGPTSAARDYAKESVDLESKILAKNSEFVAETDTTKREKILIELKKYLEEKSEIFSDQVSSLQKTITEKDTEINDKSDLLTEKDKEIERLGKLADELQNYEMRKKPEYRWKKFREERSQKAIEARLKKGNYGSVLKNALGYSILGKINNIDTLTGKYKKFFDTYGPGRDTKLPRAILKQYSEKYSIVKDAALRFLDIQITYAQKNASTSRENDLKDLRRKVEKETFK